MPEGLYARALLIIIVPMVVPIGGRLRVHGAALEHRHAAARVAVVSDIAALIEVYSSYPQDGDNAQSAASRREKLGLNVDFLPVSDMPPPGPKPFFSLVDQTLWDELRRRITKPFWIDTVGRSALVGSACGSTTVLRVSRAATPPMPPTRTSSSAGWWVPRSYCSPSPSCSCITRSARSSASPMPPKVSARAARCRTSARAGRASASRAAAFIEMKSRIERTIEQRTAMLAGVSHDLHRPHALQARTRAARQQSRSTR
jgi:two-component system osmolarity sensor histidine kinase EnvZ